jgi:hypothetical protein
MFSGVCLASTMIRSIKRYCFSFLFSLFRKRRPVSVTVKWEHNNKRKRTPHKHTNNNIDEVLELAYMQHAPEDIK